MWWLVVSGLVFGGPFTYKEVFKSEYECQKALDKTRHDVSYKIVELKCSWENGDVKGSSIPSDSR